jgi:hypothetical protein
MTIGLLKRDLMQPPGNYSILFAAPAMKLCRVDAGIKRQLPESPFRRRFHRINRQGDMTMLTKTKIAISIALALGAISVGPAMAKHRTHGHHMSVVQHAATVHGRDAEGYASREDCAARLPRQPGDAAILIQDRFFRETNGDPFWVGECR